MALVGDTTGLKELLDETGNPFLPDENSYTVTLSSGVDYFQNDHILNISDIKLYNEPFTVRCTYILATDEEAETFEEFVIANLDSAFIVTLSEDGVTLEKFVAQFASPEVSFKKKVGSTTIQLDYEVQGGL